ncbi:hypothetical protein AVEN_70146-1 [Araneus ventricosus]|uniref:Uncharacterized protein n=1 Tax=Araneus ventricosus TaxID=182803 RepID=A0A4Y2S8J3_ARAVE|nr:hypothetical protein AVEN_70146-1 [Araneus ventricosus]
MESGFEPGALWPRSRDLSSRPPLPRELRNKKIRLNLLPFFTSKFCNFQETFSISEFHLLSSATKAFFIPTGQDLILYSTVNPTGVLVSCTLNLSSVKRPPADVERSFGGGERVPVQVLFSISDRSSKLRGPSQNNPRVASEKDVHLTKLNKLDAEKFGSHLAKLEIDRHS